MLIICNHIGLFLLLWISRRKFTLNMYMFMCMYIYIYINKQTKRLRNLKQEQYCKVAL